MRYVPYYILVALLMFPVAIVDGLIAHITSSGWEFVVRFLFLLIAIQIARLIPAP
ncbi:MAG: hypothetical protein Q7T01_02025 [bacterium]|nr:hypothetical protein [bacterium]